MKTTHHIIFLTMIFMIKSVLLYGQHQIKGTVSDSHQDGIPYANILLMNASDSTLLKGSVSELDGSFQFIDLHPGRYYIEVSMIGYEKSTQSVTIDKNYSTPIHLVFGLNESSTELDAVVIKGQRPLYEKSADRTTVNVSSSTTSQGKTALQVLAKSPGVMINQQNGNISLYGKNNVTVMINGKMTRLPADAVIQMLEGMNAANIDKIELITTPPAEYDAEGNGGIINILTLNPEDAGTQGNISITSGYNQGPTWGLSTGLNHRSGRTNIFFDYNILSDENAQPWMNERRIFREGFVQEIIGNQQREFIQTNQNLRAGLEYEITKNLTANLLATGYKRDWDLDGHTISSNTAAPDSTIQTNMLLREKNIWKSGGLSMNLNYTLNSKQTISLGSDYMKYVNDNPSEYFIEEQVPHLDLQTGQIQVSKETPIVFRIIRMDYAYQINENLSLKAGIKSTHSTFENDVIVQTLNNDTWQQEDKFSSSSSLDEKIWAGYMAGEWLADQNLKFSFGLRYEYTDSYLSSPEEKGLIDREYGYLFPSITATRKIGKNQQLGIAYSRRITRPTFNEMAPFVFFVGPDSFISGNPALQPALNDAIDLNYQINQLWVSLKYNYTKDLIGQLQPELDTETGEQVFRSKNMNYMRSLTLAANYSTTLATWWELNADVSIQYLKYETTYLEDIYTDDTFLASLNATSTFMLPRDYTIEMSGFFHSKQLWGIWAFKPAGQLDIGFRKSFRNSSLALVFSDILHTNIWRPEIAMPDGQSTARMNYDLNARSVNLTFTTSFGNTKLKSANIESGAKEERQRVN